jgi:hypothetical protein
LYETEQVLFGLLSSLPPRQIGNALDGQSWAPATPSTLDKEAAIEHWNQFPLKTAADVQAWHNDRLERELQEESIDDMDMDIEHEIEIISEAVINNSDTLQTDVSSLPAPHLPEGSAQPPLGQGPRRNQRVPFGSQGGSKDKGKGTHGAKTAHTTHDIGGTFLHTSDGRYPRSRGNTQSPVEPGGSGGQVRVWGRRCLGSRKSFGRGSSGR